MDICNLQHPQACVRCARPSGHADAHWAPLRGERHLHWSARLSAEAPAPSPQPRRRLTARRFGFWPARFRVSHSAR
ncbi:MAG: hypothetical protein K0Q93_837 [Nocardioidaceae bacterium]|nr:hypothetical protein [Nocardioidaceae bacterium]